MPNIPGVGQNNPQVQQNLPVENVNQPQRAGGLSRGARVALGFATIGLSEIVIRCRRSAEPAPARNLNQQLPAIAPAEKRANADLARLVQNHDLPGGFKKVTKRASAELRRTLPIERLSDGARARIVQAIRSAEVKVTPEILASMMKEAVLSDYLHHEVISDLVSSAARAMRLDPDLATPLAGRLANKSSEVKALAQNINFNDPQQLQDFKARVAPLVNEQVAVALSVSGTIKQIQAQARAALLEATGLEDNDNFEKSVQVFLKKLGKKLAAVESGAAPDPERGVRTLGQLPDIAQQLETQGTALINDKLAIIDLIRQSDFSDAVKKEWAEQALFGGAFINQSAARNALAAAGDIARGPEARRLLETLRAEPIDKAALKAAMVDLLVQAKRNLAARTTSAADRLKYDGDVMRHVGVFFFGAVLDKSEEMRTLFNDNCDFLAEVQAELALSENNEEYSVGQSVFETVHSKDIGALFRYNKERREAAERRTDLLEALRQPADAPVANAKISNEFVGYAGGRRVLVERFGPAILPGVDPAGREVTLAFESENEAGFREVLEQYARDHETVSYGALSRLYQSFVLENYVTGLLEKMARPIAEHMNAPFAPNVRALYRNPDVTAQFEAAKSLEEIRRVAARFDGRIRALVSAEKTLVEKSAAHYDAFVAHLSERSGLSEAEVKAGLPLERFAHELCRPFYAGEDGPEHSLEFARAAEASPARMGEWLAALTTAYDARFAEIEAADVPMAVKISWRKDAVLTQAFSEPGRAAILAETAKAVDVTPLVTALGEARDLATDELAGIFRLEMRHISDELMSRVDLKKTSPEALHDLRKSLVALLFHREGRLQHFFAPGPDRLKIEWAARALDESEVSERINDELAGVAPEEAESLKASELANARECSVFFEGSQPGMKDFAATLAKKREEAAAREVEAHNQAISRAFDVVPLSDEIQAVVNRLTADLRAKFGEGIVLEGALLSEGEDWSDRSLFLRQKIRTNPRKLNQAQALEIIREHFITKFMEKQALQPMLDAKIEAGLCTREAAERVKPIILGSAFLKKLAGEVTGGDLEPLREALRRVVDEELNIQREAAAKKTELLNGFVSQLAELTGKTVDEVKERSVNLKAYLSESLDRVFDAGARRSPETGLTEKEAMAEVAALMEEEAAKCLDAKRALLEAVRASGVSDGLKASFTNQILGSAAVFSAAGFNEALKAGRLVAARPEVGQLAALLAEGGNYNADQARALLTQISASLYESIAAGLSAREAAQLEGDNLRALLSTALAVIYEAKPELAAALSRDSERAASLQLLLLDAANNSPAGVYAGCAFLEPEAMAETVKKIQARRRTPEECQALRKALSGSLPMPPQFGPVFEQALTKLRARFGEAVIPLNADPVKMRYASQAKEEVNPLLGNAATSEAIAAAYERGVAKSYMSEKIQDWFSVILAERGLPEDAASSMSLQIVRRSSRIAELIESIQRPEDVAAREAEIRGILEDYVTRHQEIEARTDAFIAEAHRQIAAAGRLELPYVQSVLSLASLRDKIDVQRPDLVCDPRTGLPDKASEDRLFNDIVPIRNEKVRLWREAFEHIDRLQISDEVKKAWRELAALSGPLFLVPRRIDGLVDLARSIPAKALEAALAANPAKPAAIGKAFQGIIEVLDRGVAAHVSPEDGTDLIGPLRASVSTLFFAEHPRLVRLLTQEKRDVVIYTLQSLNVGGLGGMQDTQFIKSMTEFMAAPVLDSLMERVRGDQVAPPDWTLIV